MADTISKISALPNPIASDGSQASVVSATVLTDGVPAAAGATVRWASIGGELSGASSVTEVGGIATINVTASTTAVAVTATTLDDSTGRTVNISTYAPHQAPQVFNASSADGFTLDHEDINFGVNAEIPVYAGVALNQIVTFWWSDVDSVVFPITDTNIPPFIIDVSSSLSSDCLKDGQYNVYYVVEDQAGNSTNSSPVLITVSDGGQTVPTLSAPVVPEADPYINIADASDGVDVNISYPDMAEGDVITFYWTGFDSSQRKIEGAEISDTYTVLTGDTSKVFAIDSSLFYPGGKGYQGYSTVYYTVIVGSSSLLELSETLTCLVDTLAP
jgi:hypothetical protein